MRKILLSIALLCSVGLFAQNLVSTTPQNKKVVLEEFTGIYCGYCPDGHARAQAIKDQNPDDVFLVNVHTGGFSNPGVGHPDFRTDFGPALDAQAYLPNQRRGYPSGTINRHIFFNEQTILNRGQWASAANQILQQKSYVNIAGTADIDVSTNELIVTVEVYYTGDSPENTNKLNVALLQDNTLGYQNGGGMGNNYVHMHRLVHFLTGQWGADILKTKESSFNEFTFTYKIPNDYRNINVVLEDLKVIAYVAEGRQEIITAAEMQRNYVNVPGNDIAIKNIEDITPTCLDRISPKIEIQNRGGNNSLSLDITYSVNNSTPKTYTWTGNLNTYATKSITLDEISFTPHDHINRIEVSIPDDDNNDNNFLRSSFNPSIKGSINSTLQINSFASGPTTTWEIKDLSDNILYNGGPYSTFTTQTIELELPDGCYEISIKDTSEKGRSTFTLIDENSVKLFESGNNYGSEISGDFRTNSQLNADDFAQESIILYPNPTNGIVHIENAEGFQVEIYNILGKTVLNKTRIANQETLNLSNLTAGVYYVKLQNENTTEVKKVVVK